MRDILRHFGCFSFTGSSNFLLYLLTKSLSFFSSTIGLFPRAALTCSSLSLVSTAKCHMCMCELYLVRLHFVLGICFLFWQSVRINQKRDLYYPCIFTIQYPVPLFSLCTKSLIAVLKDANQLSEETGGGPFC